MQEVIDMELHAYLSEILKLLHEEKLAPVNTIDSLMATAANITAMKECPNCNQKNIKNRKQICPRCKERLPTLAKIQNEKSIENNVIDQQSKPLIFKPYSINDELSSVSVPRISLTQQQIIEQGVNIPEIYIPDPININPNSIANVEKVLSHIETISGIKDESRQLHEEMNMLRAYVELNWEINLKQFASCQGYRTENQLVYFKKCVDHHKSWDSVCNIYRQAIAMELMWPYVKSHSNPSVEGYLVWVNEQQDPLYRAKYEQTFVYLQAIINYRKAIRTNNSFLKRAAKRSFSPIWSARRHPIYRFLEVTDEVQLMRLYPEVCETIEKNCVVSRSGIYEQHQGLDAIIEEVNKALKALIPPVPQYHHWKVAARNCKKFFELRNNLFKLIGYNDLQASGPRTQLESTMECQRFRIHLRSLEFTNLDNARSVCQSLGEHHELSEHLKNFTHLAKQARQNYIIEVFFNKNPPPFFRPIPITKQEADAQENEENIKKAEILLKIETLLEHCESARKKYLGLKSKKRSELLDILQDIKHAFNSNNEFND
ncbi:hypothetical protein Glove_122g71 [Diversispora epigaea]|uniref:Uncharacterized protein n=1 Tax=Diversispora epigaea TaxID=1348612 RepID=A0A397J8W6_9GLOM|nr:hypothetical protein Glove_122g71 [Diversispora epigaea]